MAKILVVDDELVMLSLTARILSQKYEVLTAKSGQEALRLYETEKPDLILSDLVMPDMSGFEMYESVQKMFGKQVPVVFMSGADGDGIEKKGFERGASDFIRKPFQASVLLRRIDNILLNLERIRGLAEEASRDSLTGFLNKGAVTEKLTELCRMRKGILLVVDLDCFKLVNDLYGHEKGDAILRVFSDIMRKNTRSADIAGRIGGDEFVLFCTDSTERATVSHICERMNRQFVEQAKALLGENMAIPLGVSIGAAVVPDNGSDFVEVFKQADQALYSVKQNGKHSFAFCDDHGVDATNQQEDDLQSLNMIFEERNVTNGAYYIGRDAFTQVYRFFLRYVRTYKESAYTLLMTLSPTPLCRSFAEISDFFGDIVGKSLRKSDIMVRIRQNQYLLLLPHVPETFFDPLVERILKRWNSFPSSSQIEIRYESQFISVDSSSDDSGRIDTENKAEQTRRSED